MTCDDAFDELTSPDGRTSPRLAAHLNKCARCRAMAETLAPAIDLFGATATALASPPTSAVAVATKSAARLARRDQSTLPSHRGTWERRLGLALVAAAGAACCFIAIQLGGQQSDRSATTVTCPRQSPLATEWMNRNSFPVAMACIACHPPAGALVPSATGAKPATAMRGTL